MSMTNPQATSGSEATAPEFTNRGRNVVSASLRQALLFIRRKPLAGFGLVICLLLVCVAVFADVIAPNHYSTSAGGALESPNGTYLMGTDRLGRDTFSRIVYGARVSIYVGLGAVVVSAAVALFLGMLSVAGHQALDIVVQRFVDAFMAFPSLILLLTVVAVIGPSLWGMIFVLRILTGVSSSRVIRSAVLTVRTQDYILAGQSIGCNFLRLQFRYILPNILPTLIVMATVTIGAAILAEASVSFLGFGVPPPTPTWGIMAAEGRPYVELAWWAVTFPGLAIMLLVLSINVLGDVLRDRLDPKFNRQA